jgi:16S rRNA (adenine1518-N6/adenine1519-N6)-dimethyltransferase
VISFREIQLESSDNHANKQFVGQRAKKSLGQNFLVDGNIARKIVSELSISKDEPVLEIGPGKGALTRLLVKKTSHVIAVEKDKSLCNSLREEFGRVPHFELIDGDFLHYDFNLPNRMIKVVGNIPYNLTSKIVSRLVDFRSNINFAVIMVQEEVAERLAAKPGTKAYGAISIRLQLTGQVKKLFSVSPTCFQPRPKVNSRIIRISFCQREPLAREEVFVTFVKRAFGMRRKMLRHFVSHYYGQSGVERLPTEFHARRIETLPPEKIYGIFSILDKHA